MSNVIILEGVDGGGKTTLAKWLEKERGYFYSHEGVPPLGISLIEYYSTRLWQALQGKMPVVFDRLHLGEMIYGSIARHEDRVGYYGMKLFLRILRSQPVICFICLPEFETAVRNWSAKFEAKNDYLGKFDRFKDCYYRYRGLLSYSPHQRYDYEKQPMEWVHAISPVRAVSCFPDGVIGSRRAKYLVVGEQVSLNVRKVDFPFFGEAGCSRLLNDSLWAAGFDEDDLMFTNVKNLKGLWRNLDSITNRLPNIKAIIALGGVAWLHCQEHSCVPSFKVNHPQYAKRFKSKMKDSYVDQLKEVLESCQSKP